MSACVRVCVCYIRTVVCLEKQSFWTAMKIAAVTPYGFASSSSSSSSAGSQTIGADGGAGGR